MRHHPANKFHANSTHASYGIYNYLKSKNITDNTEQNMLVLEFAALYKFDWKNKKPDSNSNPLMMFISNRFQEFVKFINKVKSETL